MGTQLSTFHAITLSHVEPNNLRVWFIDSERIMTQDKYFRGQTMDLLALSGRSAPSSDSGGCSVLIRDEERDALRAQEMNRLSPSEREDVLNDIHGVPNLPSENKGYLQDKFQELERAISLELAQEGNGGTIAASNDAYKQAMLIDPRFANDQTLRLAFLRAESFNVTSAAKRFLAFFHEKLQLFGPSLLCITVTLQHLNSADIDVLRSGQLQLLPNTDQAGRRILCRLGSYENCKYPENVLRAIYYMTMAAIEDEETQRKGLVGVVYNFPNAGYATVRDSFLNRLVRLYDVLPVRYVGMHYCVKDAAAAGQVNREICLLERKTRLRCRVHNVSPMESRYALASFGIPLPSLPVAILGTLKIEDHQQWMHQRACKEAERSMICSRSVLPITLSDEEGLQRSLHSCLSHHAVVMTPHRNHQSPEPLFDEHPPLESGVVVPTPFDVLFGRGKVKNHPGNMLLHRLIGERRDRYEQAVKWEKTVIAEEIASIIREHSGRFLRMENRDGQNIWTVVDEATAREKVSHTFRSERSRSTLPSRSKRRVEGNLSLPSFAGSLGDAMNSKVRDYPDLLFEDNILQT